MAKWKRSLRILAVLGGVLLASGCTIGTWPQPEGDDDAFADGNTNNGNGNGGGSASGAGEACDGLDDDGDGVIDEGCSCDPTVDVPRDCVGVLLNECATGTQSCVDGRWSTCDELISTGTVAGVGSITVETDRTSVVAGGDETIVVEATVTPACDGVVVPSVAVVLRLSNPIVELRATALDDGLDADTVAGDGVYAATLTNLLSSALSGQTITVEGSALLDREEVVGVASIALEDAP